MRYSEIINESPYEELERYVRHNEYIPHSVVDLIPQHPSSQGILYRGLSFNSQDRYDAFMASIEDGTLENNSPSSWTNNLGVAREFATMEKSYDPTASALAGMREMNQSGDFTYAYGGVVLKTSAQAGAGLDVSDALGGSSESEVILPSGTYRVEIAEIIVPYRRQYDSPEKIQLLYDRIMAGEDQDKIHFFTNSILPHLTPEQAAAYAEKTVSDSELFRWYASYGHGTTELTFKVYFEESDYQLFSDETKDRVRREGAEAARQFVREIMEMPDEAFMAERSGVFVEGLVYAPDWSNIAKPIAARAAKLYHGMNANAAKNSDQRGVEQFTKGVMTLLKIIKMATARF